MRKILLAATMVALLPLLSACNKNNGNGETRFEDPRFVQYAGQLIPCSNPTPTKAEATPASALASIELTESGLYAIGVRSGSELSYRTGDYTVNGEVYTLNGYGTIQFNNSASGRVELVCSPTGGTAEKMSADFTKASGGNQLYRGWTVDRTRVTVRGWTTASADFQGCNFYEIAKFIRDNGHDVPDDIEPGMKLQSISFTGTEKMLFVYSDNSADVSEFTLTGSNITYTWDDDKMGFTFLSPKATVEYMDGKCILTVSATIENSTSSGSVTFVLSPMD